MALRDTPVVAPPAAPPGTGRHAPWRFWTALGLNLFVIFAVPAPKYAAYASNTTVQLRVMPVDPMDVLRGRYVRLGYDLGSGEVMGKVPGWSAVSTDELYVTLAPGKAGEPWKPVFASATWPTDVKPGQVVLQCHRGGDGADPGLGEYMVPEDHGDVIEKGLRDAKGKALADVRVDAWGHSVLVGLTIGGKHY